VTEKYIDAFFDAQRFLEEMDKVRQERQMSWAQVEEVTGLTYQNLYRIKNIGGTNIHARTLTALVLWSGVDPRSFMINRNGREEATA
jgi:hypothetical protein